MSLTGCNILTMGFLLPHKHKKSNKSGMAAVVVLEAAGRLNSTSKLKM